MSVVHGLFVALAIGCASSAEPRRYSDARALGPGAHAVGVAGEAESINESYADAASRADRPPSRADLEPANPGWIGVELQTSGQNKGAAIASVVKRSPASQAGLAPGDLIVRVEGQPMADPAALVRRIRSTMPGTPLSLEVNRHGELRRLVIRTEPAPNPDELLRRRFVGLAAPPIDGLTVVSGDVTPTWAALRGDLVVLEFWAPWCGVCRFMHQRLNEWHAQWAMRGVKILGVVALAPEQAHQFAVRWGMGYAILADPAESVFRAFDVFAVPSLFLVDRRGKVIDASTGYSSLRLAHMEKQLAALIDEGREP